MYIGCASIRTKEKRALRAAEFQWTDTEDLVFNITNRSRFKYPCVRTTGLR